MYGKEASNREQEIDRQHHTILNQRPKDKHCGNVYNRLWNLSLQYLFITVINLLQLKIFYQMKSMTLRFTI